MCLIKATVSHMFSFVKDPSYFGLWVWWWTGRPGVLRFMGSQRVRFYWVTELNWLSCSWSFFPFPSLVCVFNIGLNAMESKILSNEHNIHWSWIDSGYSHRNFLWKLCYMAGTKMFSQLYLHSWENDCLFAHPLFSKRSKPGSKLPASKL